ncbi:MAG: CrcB family protein [Bacteroidia bacterium]|nr:CrcB family protein [Bacteroidia bacterium]
MRLTLLIGISLGAAGGALLRYWIQRILNLSLLSPGGTFLVNIIGSAILGFVAGGFPQKVGSPLYYAVTAGFCGSLTTFSSITLEIFEMLRLQEGLRAMMYIVLTLGLGLMGFAGGYWLGAKLTS